MNSLKKILFVLILFIIAGCGSIKLNKLDTYFCPIPTSNKKLDIPKYGAGDQFNGYPFIYWNFCKQKQKQLGLISPEISKDSLIFRMWITNPAGRKNQPHGLIEIIRDSSKWSGKLVLMRVNFKLSKLSEKVTDYKIINLNPLSTNWETVIDSLLKLKIDVLPTDDMIPNTVGDRIPYDNNEPTFSFEYATKDIYRFYQYNDIYHASDLFWPSNNVKKILKLLENEFHWDSEARRYFY